MILPEEELTISSPTLSSSGSQRLLRWQEASLRCLSSSCKVGPPVMCWVSRVCNLRPSGGHVFITPIFPMGALTRRAVRPFA